MGHGLMDICVYSRFKHMYMYIHIYIEAMTIYIYMVYFPSWRAVAAATDRAAAARERGIFGRD